MSDLALKHTYIHIYTHIYMHTYIHTYIEVHTSDQSIAPRAAAHKHIYTHTYIRTHTHTYIQHTYTNTATHCKTPQHATTHCILKHTCTEDN